MTDRSHPTGVAASDPLLVAASMRYGGGDWVIPAGTDMYASHAELNGPLDAFDYDSADQSGFVVSIQPGEAFVEGAWLGRDAVSSVDLVEQTANQTVYVGWRPSATNYVRVGLDTAFEAVDLQLALYDFDTDGSGVTSVTDRRPIGEQVSVRNTGSAASADHSDNSDRLGGVSAVEYARTSVDETFGASVSVAGVSGTSSATNSKGLGTPALYVNAIEAATEKDAESTFMQFGDGGPLSDITESEIGLILDGSLALEMSPTSFKFHDNHIEGVAGLFAERVSVDGSEALTQADEGDLDVRNAGSVGGVSASRLLSMRSVSLPFTTIAGNDSVGVPFAVASGNFRVLRSAVFDNDGFDTGANMHIEITAQAEGRQYETTVPESGTWEVPVERVQTSDMRFRFELSNTASTERVFGGSVSFIEET